MKKSIFIYNIDKAIGKAVRELRNEKGLKMRELAYIANVPHSFFGKIENYERRITYGELEELASWMGVPVSEIITKAKVIEKRASEGED